MDIMYGRRRNTTQVNSGVRFLLGFNMYTFFWLNGSRCTCFWQLPLLILLSNTLVVLTHTTYQIKYQKWCDLKYFCAFWMLFFYRAREGIDPNNPNPNANPNPGQG